MEQLGMFQKEKSNDWKWSMAKDYPKSNGLKVFSCFACGGGSTMGYKLAGCEVIGCNEIDPRMNKVYVQNHHPKYNYLEDIRDFNKRQDLPEELYNLDILDGSPPCFEKGTLIKTFDGYKNIENIAIGDYVFTHKGNYKKVYNTMNKITDEYYELKIQGCLPFKVTPNHPFYVRKMNRHNKYGKKVFEEAKWVEVKDLSIVRNNSKTILEQDYIGVPIIKENKIPEWTGIKYKHNIYGKQTIIKEKHNLDLSSYNLWYFIGRYIGDGWLSNSKKEVLICCGKNEKEELENIIKSCGLSYSLSEERTTYRATISNVELYEYIKQFGSGAKNKHLTKDIFELPIYLLQSFIDGYLSADGYYDKQHNLYKITSISKNLIYGIQQCVAKCYNKPTTITTKTNNGEIEGRVVNTNLAYTLSFKKEKCKQQHFFYEDGYLWIPFRSKKLVKKQLKVFNISVEDDESYTVYNFGVHNCSTFSMAGQREDAWGKKKKFREGQKEQTLDDLLFVFIDTVAKLRPKVVIMENVEGLMLGNAWKYVQEIYKRFGNIGYKVKHWLLKGEQMGVPQTRHRVFFIATRLDFDLNSINLSFDYEPVLFKEVKAGIGGKVSSSVSTMLQNANENDKSLADVNLRLYGKCSRFNEMIVWDNEVCPTIHSHGFYRGNDGTKFSMEDYRNCQTFPQDYDFCGEVASYICGMSVPPLMIKRIMTRLIESKIFGEIK